MVDFNSSTSHHLLLALWRIEGMVETDGTIMA